MFFNYRNIFKYINYLLIMLRIKRLSEAIGKTVYTDAGDLFGLVEEINIADNKIDGWRIVVSQESELAEALGGARGIIIPHQFIRAIGDIVIISKNAIPVKVSSEENISEEEALM